MPAEIETYEEGFDTNTVGLTIQQRGADGRCIMYATISADRADELADELREAARRSRFVPTRKETPR